MANPNVSNPGPKFAVDDGALTVIFDINYPSTSSPKLRILLNALSRLTIPSPVEFEIGINPCANPLRFNPRRILVVNVYVSPSVSLEIAFSNVFK